MITVFIGHRGVGKTSLLNHAKHLGISLDLDQYIEKCEGLSIEQIWEEQGESHFRQLEEYSFYKIYREYQYSKENLYCAIGAGFQFSLPEDVITIWIQRLSDCSGRVFFNRPQLNTQSDPRKELLDHFFQREERYSQMAWETLTLREGEKHFSQQKAWISNQIQDCTGALTLSPENFLTPKIWKHFIEKRLLWGFNFFEIRDDLLSSTQIEAALAIIPPEKILFSFRHESNLQEQNSFSLVDANIKNWDWPLELGPCPYGTPPISSLHQREEDESLADLLKKMETHTHSHLKVAVEIYSFQELLYGHLWAQKDSKNRSFLPRSPDGRWQWYRLLSKGRTPLNFIQEGRSPSQKVLDQPSLLQWLSTPSHTKAFAAVVGSPVEHSWTPVEHQEFFSQLNMPVLSIPVQRDEFHEAFGVLETLGLRACAVTSPLKEMAFQFSSNSHMGLDAYNTLFFDSSSFQWFGTNTDIDGLKRLFESVPDKEDICFWGGGGTLSSLKKQLPQGSSYSAREGTPREGEVEYNHFTGTLVWASYWVDPMVWPPENWQPTKVIDLNYREDSPGRSYALKIGAEYISGESMFREQAQGQRSFWSEKLNHVR